jgi:hypothetical protein
VADGWRRVAAAPCPASGLLHLHPDAGNTAPITTQGKQTLWHSHRELLFWRRYAGAAVKFPPVDGRPAGFGKSVVRLGDFRRLSGGPITTQGKQTLWHSHRELLFWRRWPSPPSRRRRSRLEPILPICTSPEARARTTLAPLSNFRQSTVAPLAFTSRITLLAALAVAAFQAQAVNVTVAYQTSAERCSISGIRMEMK